MNRKKIFNTLGMMLQIEAFLLIPSILCAAIYGEECLIWLLLTAVITFVIGSALKFVTRKSSDIIYAREGFITVALTWVCLSAFGALPFTLSGEIPSYIDAFFETVSGFTTTGASILNDVEAMSHGLLFWRSFTHWVGGMGILVFMMAIVPAGNDRSIHIMRAEMPGPVVGKLVPRARDTAKILYIIYVGMTFLQVILIIGSMPLVIKSKVGDVVKLNASQSYDPEGD
ncbi:MAG: TrkH family potassium uptake protein, partial [Oscillospiraceae bacterium]|nr:TrkH family potassium uptake protein [Oscillospiraceae bacterium]